jgi:hypothetical protein
VLVDAHLPSGAAFAVTIDLNRIGAALPGGSLDAALEKGAGVKVTAADLGIDTSRPIMIAQRGVSSAPNPAIDAFLTRPQQSSDGAADALQKAAKNLDSGTALRFVVPSSSTAKTKAALAVGLSANGAKSVGDSDFAFGKHLLVTVSEASDAVVIDVGTGEDPKKEIVAMRAQIANGPKYDGVALEGHAVHGMLAPATLERLGVLTIIEHGAFANTMPNLDARDREKIAAATQKSAVGVTGVSPYQTIDVAGDVDGKKMTVALRGTPAPTIAAAAWQPAPSIAVDGGVGIASVSGALLRGWSFSGDKKGEPIAKWSSLEPIRENPISTMLALGPGLPILIARLVAQGQPGVEPGALERFERSGYFFRPSHEPAFFGLLPKSMSGAAAECVLREKANCAAKDRLKLDTTTPVGEGFFARLVRVKSGASCVLIAREKGAIENVQLSAATAPAFEMSIPTHLALSTDSFDVPGMPRDGKLQATLAEDNHTTLLKVTAP